MNNTTIQFFPHPSRKMAWGFAETCLDELRRRWGRDYNESEFSDKNDSEEFEVTGETCGEKKADGFCDWVMRFDIPTSRNLQIPSETCSHYTGAACSPEEAFAALHSFAQQFEGNYDHQPYGVGDVCEVLKECFTFMAPIWNVRVLNDAGRETPRFSLLFTLKDIPDLQWFEPSIRENFWFEINVYAPRQ